MEIKSRAFPYPVLGPGSDDFSDGALRLLGASAETAPERYSVRFSVELTHPSFLTMITEGTAALAVVIECRQNLYRRRVPIQLGSNLLEIAADELRGVVQITPIISAATDLADYRPSSLNSDYDGVRIHVPRHGLLAHGPNLEFIAEPKADRLKRISSIMRVVQVDGADRAFNVNIDGPRIRVEVSLELFRLYQKLSASKEGTSILASMLVLPVLVDVFHRIKGEESDGFSDHRWYQVVRARLREIGQPNDSLDFNPMKAAQALLDSPFSRGVSELIQKLDLEGADNL